MIGKEAKLERLASIPEVLEVLEARKEGGELGYEQQLAYEYAKKFSKVEGKDARTMGKELEELGLSAKTAVAIVNVMPLEMMQLKQILANEKKEVGEDVAAKAMAVIEQRRGK
jgi:DNA-directed RNA polymerase subunit F